MTKVGRGGISKDNISVFRYEGVIKRAVIALKYKFSTEIARELADACVERLIANNYSLSAVLIPVPLHWYRQNLRGFNQSEEIGKLISMKMDWKFIPDLLIKKKSTPPQVGLKGLSRRRNLNGSFSLNTKYKILNTDYVLFDDVYTTGSTLKEAIKALKGAGAKKIWGLTIAR